MSWTGPSSVWGSDSLFQRHSELFLWGHVKSPPIMLSSLLQAADHVTEQEVRSEHRQDGAPWGPGQAVRLIYTHSTGTQGPQGVATTLPAAMQCHQDDTERAVEDAKLLPHLAKLSGETLQRKNASYSWIISDLSHLFVPVYKKNLLHIVSAGCRCEYLSTLLSRRHRVSVRPEDGVSTDHYPELLWWTWSQLLIQQRWENTWTNDRKDYSHIHLDFS